MKMTDTEAVTTIQNRIGEMVNNDSVKKRNGKNEIVRQNRRRNSKVADNGGNCIIGRYLTLLQLISFYELSGVPTATQQPILVIRRDP